MVFEISRKIFLKRGKCVAQMRHHVSSVSGWYSTTPILRDLGPQVSTEKKRFTPSPRYNANPAYRQEKAFVPIGCI